MKVLNKFIMGAALVALTACSSAKSVDYKTFHEKALEAAEKRVTECDYTKVVVKGTMKSDGEESKLDTTLAVEKGVPKMESMEQMVAALLASMTAETITDDDESKYYVGGGFRVVADNEDVKGEAKFDKYGLPTLYKVEYKADSSNSTNITLKWSK